jgi:SAM-dependent methyltransferase
MARRPAPTPGSAAQAAPAGGRLSPTPGPDRAGPEAPFYTGERPCWGRGLFGYDEARALAPYAYVAPLAAGRRVLDAGCGEGFGTRTLARVARSVDGIDYSDRAIAYCRRTWTAPGLSFRVVDLSDPAATHPVYDLVISFQVIEHIEDDVRFLETLRGWLAPGGIVVVVTPNRSTSFSQNPYNVREYTAGELAARLRRVFGAVEMLGVHGSERLLAFERRRRRTVEAILRLDGLGLRRLLPRSLLTFAFGRLAVLVRVVVGGARVASQFDVEDFPVHGENVDAALDLLAVCRC